MGSNEIAFLGSGESVQAATKDAEARAAHYFADRPVPDFRVGERLVGGQLDNNGELVGPGTYAVQLIYPLHS
jgi:hypothetical protein